MDENGGNGGGGSREPRKLEGKPLGFPMLRESEGASRLKAHISEKLLHCFNEFSDDILAEYITVLVCNGRSQFRAREDLKPFFGEKSGDFVTWLWELLQNEFPQDKQGNSAFDPRITGGFGPSGTAIYKDSKSGPKDHNYLSSDPIQSLKAEAEKTSLASVSACAIASTKNEASQKSTEVNYMNGLRKVRIDDCSRMEKVFNKDNRNSSTYNYSGKISSIAVPAFEQQDSIQSDKSKETVPERSGIILCRHLGLPNIEPDLRAPQYVPPGSFEPPFHWEEKPRVSVWDRLGKPSDDLSVGIENPSMPKISIQTLKKKLLHWQEPTFSAPNNEHIKRSQREVPAGCNRHENFKSHSSRQLETGIVTRSERHIFNNLARKRPSGDMGSSAEDVSVIKGVSGPLQYKEPSQHVKKPNLLPKQSAKLDLVSEVSKMQERLDQVKMQISKLQSQQSKKQKVGEPKIQSQCGDLHRQEYDLESRTIFVTNIHSAASKGAISMFFAKCGAVEGVEILVEEDTPVIARSVMVTFASRESVDKAIAMSGTSFYSRKVQVARSTEIDAPKPATTRSSQTKGSGFFREHNHSSPHLKWHRDPTTSTRTPPQSRSPTPRPAPAPAPASAAVAVAAPAPAQAGTQRQAT